MNENPDLEQNYFSRQAKSLSKIGPDSFRILKRMAYYDLYYDNRNYSD